MEKSRYKSDTSAALMREHFYSREPASAACASIGGIVQDGLSAQSESVNFTTSFAPDILGECPRSDVDWVVWPKRYMTPYWSS
jgi:hypothetical protein